MSLSSLIIISLAASACAGSGFMEKKEGASEAQQKLEQVEQKLEQVVEQSGGASAQAMKSAVMSQLAKYMTEEGQKEHEKAVKAEEHFQVKGAAEEMEWLADVARDGSMDFGNGVKYSLLDTQSPLGKLPKGLPETPTDPTKREDFRKMLALSGVDLGTYNTMLSLKKDSSMLVEIAQEEFKSKLSSLMETKEEMKPAQSVVQTEEKIQNSLEIIKASPTGFKQALKSWEKMVPEATTMLLQTTSAESPQEAKEVFMQAKELSNRATALHQVVFDSVEQVANKEKLMSVAQNRITSLLMRQAEASLSDFDALDGCTEQAKDYSGSEARCLCVADNICSKAGQANGGDYCSIVSSATCMSPKNGKEASEMSTV